MMMKAPVGPPICTLLPPKREIISPAMMAVTNPSVGPTPDEIPKAMANGMATIPTMIPASASCEKRLALYDLSAWNSFGANTSRSEYSIFFIVED